MIRALSLAALLLALPAVARADLAETQTAVVKLGGTATVEKELDDGCRVAVKFAIGTDALLTQLAKLPEVGALHLDDATKCTEKGFAALKELPNLQRLTVGKCQLTDAKAAALGTLRPLTVLHVSDSGLTDTGLAAMKKLVNLTSLDLLGAPLTDKAAATLAGFKKLKELNLAGTKVTDKGIEPLAAIETLKLLKLHNTNVTRKGIDAIEKALPKLTVRW